MLKWHRGQYRLAGDYAMNRLFERSARRSRRVCGQTQRTAVAVEAPKRRLPPRSIQKRQPPFKALARDSNPANVPLQICRARGALAAGRDSIPKWGDGQRYTARLHGAARIAEGGPGTPRSSSRHWLSFSSPSLTRQRSRGRGRDAVGHLTGRARTHIAGARIWWAYVRV
jgi:hypothetical protein